MSHIVAYSPRGRILFDDTVLDKNSSHKIEGAVSQHSGNAHHAVTGIGVVTYVYHNPTTDRYYPLDLGNMTLSVTAKQSLTMSWI